MLTMAKRFVLDASFWAFKATKLALGKRHEAVGGQNKNSLHI